MINNVLRSLLIKDFSISSSLSIFQKVLLIIFFNILLILASQVKIYLPFLPVPFTLQTLVILLIGGILGHVYGTLAVVLYVIEGALGLPVFANFSDLSKVSYTLGYILGFIPATFSFGLLLSYLIKHNKINLFNLFIASFISVFWVFLFGLSWIFYLTNNIYLTLFHGLFPFIITEFIKIIISSLIIKSLYNLKNLKK